VFQGQRHLLQAIELNPGPVNGYLLLQSSLAERGLSILDVGGAGDCFFRAVSHQLYGEPIVAVM